METVQLLERYSRAIEARRFEDLEDTLSPAVHLRVLLPGGYEEWDGRHAVLDCIRGWFGGWELHLLEHRVDNVAGRWSIRHRFEARGAEARTIIEQHMYCTVREGRVTQMDLLCSGFLPASLAPGLRETFDAGDLGCGDGLAAAFRRQLDAIPAGSVLEVITSDPAARADLPPLARLMGNNILDVCDRDDGRTVIVVEKVR